MPSLGGSVPMHAVYMFSCKHSRTYDATAMAICMRRRARVRSVIRTSSSAANKPAATNCHPRSRRLPFPSPQSLRNKTKPKIYWGSTAATASDQKRMLARSGRGVLARIAVKECVGIVHSALFTRPHALWRLAHAAKTTGRATSRRVGILADVANVAAQFGPGASI